jgi:hypothetical protein
LHVPATPQVRATGKRCIIAMSDEKLYQNECCLSKKLVNGRGMS